MNLADRIKSIPESIFATMSRMAVEHKAVNLGQGFPDFDGPSWIMDEAYKAMKEGKNQYAPMNGILTLRKQLSELAKSKYDLDWDFNKEITITAGATEALFSTFNAIINQGDEVILFEPYYDSYEADVILSGGKPVYVTLHKPDFSFDMEELEKAVSDKTKVIVVNNPHNPTGKVFTQAELQLLAEFAIKHDLIVISDEVYEFLLFDDVKHIPIVTLPGMKDRTITISSCGKTFGMTGWKVGFAYAIPKFTEAIQKVHQWTTFAVNTPGQHAMAYAFSRIDDYVPEFQALYQSKRNLLFELLKETKFKAHNPAGTYFMMVDIPESSDMNDIESATKLVKENKVATIPPSVFYSKSDEGSTMLRLCFAKSEETLRAGVERLKEF